METDTSTWLDTVNVETMLNLGIGEFDEQLFIIPFILLLLLFFGSVAYYALERRKKRRQRRGQRVMSNKERKRAEELDRIVADAITDSFEEMELKGIMSRQEVDAYYREMGRRFRLRDLLPKRIQRTKEQIIARLNSGIYGRVDVPDRIRLKTAHKLRDVLKKPARA